MLINTKIQSPSLRSGLLYRKSLIQRLCAAEDCSFILISGPAGSGKTSLICQWIRRAPLKIAWYSLDQEDNVPDLFFRYLLSALGQTEKRFNKAFGPLMESRRALAGDSVIDHLIASFPPVKQDIHLVLDDFHHIVDMEILEALARLLKYLPTRLHLVILSRHHLPFSLSAITIKKERLEIFASDLKFTEQETENLFKKVIPISLSLDQIHTLNRYMEGWAAGLQLVGLFVKSKGSDVDLSYILNQAHDQAAGYLIHDILRLQSEKVRNFIYATALLDRFSPELCIEVTDVANSESMLARLLGMNFFLIPLDSDGKWYRYHHMFAEVVRRQVSIDTPDLILATLRTAAAWFAKHHYLEDALRSAFRSKDFEFAADLMEDHILQYMETHDPTAGIRWIRRLPCRILDQRGLLRLYQCGFLILLMEYAAAKEMLSDLKGNSTLAFEKYSGPKRKLCEEYRTQYNGLLQIFHMDKDEDTAQLQDLKLKFSTQNQLLSSGIEMLKIFICISKGDLASAENSLAKVSALPVRPSARSQKLYHAKANALIARYRGQLHQAEAILKQAISPHAGKEHDAKIPMAFLLYRHLGHIFYLQNKLEKAKAYDAIVAQHNEYAGLLDEVMTGYELRFLLHLAAGETEQATLRIQQLSVLSIQFGKPEIARSAEANAARLAIENGSPASAELWARQRRLNLDEPFSMLFAMEGLTLARLFFVQQRYPDAAHWLEILRNRCRKRGLAELVLKVDILSTAVFHALNQQKKAKSFLRKALLFSEREGYLRPFVNDAVLIAPILRRIADERPHPISDAHLETIFTASNIPYARPSAAQRVDSYIHEDLTEREIEILGWMAQGLQNKEIAQEAFVSINTVKFHVRNILAKLSVSTRGKAILKAREMKIF